MPEPCNLSKLYTTIIRLREIKKITWNYKKMLREINQPSNIEAMLRRWPFHRWGALEGLACFQSTRPHNVGMICRYLRKTGRHFMKIKMDLRLKRFMPKIWCILFIWRYFVKENFSIYDIFPCRPLSFENDVTIERFERSVRDFASGTRQQKSVEVVETVVDSFSNLTAFPRLTPVRLKTLIYKAFFKQRTSYKLNKYEEYLYPN